MTTTEAPAVQLQRLQTVTDYCERHGLPPGRHSGFGTAVHLSLFADGLEVSLHGDATTVAWAEGLAGELGAGPLRPTDSGSGRRYSHITGTGAEHLYSGVTVRVYVQPADGR